MNSIEISSWFIFEEIAEGSTKTSYIFIYSAVMLTIYHVKLSDDRLKPGLFSRKSDVINFMIVLVEFIWEKLISL